VQQIVGEEEVILEIMEFVDYLSKLTCHRWGYGELLLWRLSMSVQIVQAFQPEDTLHV
jgi:hypothetical protein